MRNVQVQEFSLSTVVEYARPVAYEEAKLEVVAKSLCASDFAGFLTPAEISLTKNNLLYSYALTAPLFNGVGGITINAQGITVSFKQGRTDEHLKLMTKITLATLAIAKVDDIKRTVFSFSAHASFSSQSDYDEHMKRFTALSEGVSSGGAILVLDLPDIKGEIKYASEKSLVYPNGLYLAGNAVSSVEATEDLFNRMGARFEELAKLDGVAFQKK